MSLDLHAAAQAVGRAHRDGAHPVVAEVLLHLQGEDAAVVELDLEGVVDLRQLIWRKLDVDHRPGDLERCVPVA